VLERRFLSERNEREAEQREKRNNRFCNAATRDTEHAQIVRWLLATGKEIGSPLVR
jgi:hypothetical protein